MELLVLMVQLEQQVRQGQLVLMALMVLPEQPVQQALPV
jgi:hypothetical protein